MAVLALFLACGGVAMLWWSAGFGWIYRLVVLCFVCGFVSAASYLIVSARRSRQQHTLVIYEAAGKAHVERNGSVVPGTMTVIGHDEAITISKVSLSWPGLGWVFHGFAAYLECGPERFVIIVEKELETVREYLARNLSNSLYAQIEYGPDIDGFANLAL